jgi:hypothetical protein
MPVGAPTGFAHQRCYAASMSDCSADITREHYISEVVLNQLAERNSVKIGGLPWQPGETMELVPVPRLVTKALCKRHNEALSPLDAAAGRFLGTLRVYDAHFNEPAPIDELVLFSGHDIERWMLKLVCGSVAAGSVLCDGEVKSREVQEAWIDILFRGAEFPVHWGLYSATPGILRHSQSLDIEWRTDPATRIVLAAGIAINGHPFWLVLGKPDNPAAFGVYRPRTIVLKQGQVRKCVELAWDDQLHDAVATYDRAGTYDGPSPSWPAWGRK